MTLLIAPALLIGLMLIAAVTLRVARRRLAADTHTLVEAVEAALPQTQCAQCGYPGCRPYAEALLAGAPLDLCPPGGRRTQKALAELLGRPAGAPLDDAKPQRAVIDENRCIGCYLCIEACPVDAIVGARQWLHTVIEDRCTGCELCLPPCPMDCIELRPTAASAPTVTPDAAELAYLDDEAVAVADPCIRCGRCREVCPEGLYPELLLWECRGAAPDAARRQDVNACIECGLCNKVCPSGIDLVATFARARADRVDDGILAREAERARRLFEERTNRLAAAAESASERRDQRLRAGDRRW